MNFSKQHQKNYLKNMEKTIKELEELVSTFEHRKLFTNDSIIMVGDLEKLKNLIMKLKLWKH